MGSAGCWNMDSFVFWVLRCRSFSLFRRSYGSVPLPMYLFLKNSASAILWWIRCFFSSRLVVCREEPPLLIWFWELLPPAPPDEPAPPWSCFSTYSSTFWSILNNQRKKRVNIWRSTLAKNEIWSAIIIRRRFFQILHWREKCHRRFSMIPSTQESIVGHLLQTLWELAVGVLLKSFLRHIFVYV